VSKNKWRGLFLLDGSEKTDESTFLGEVKKKERVANGTSVLNI